MQRFLSCLLWIRALINAAGFINWLIVAGGVALIGSMLTLFVDRFANAHWGIQAAFIFGIVALVWVPTWIFFPAVVRWRVRRMGLLQTRGTLPSFEDELRESDRVWAFWYNGGNARNQQIFREIKKPHRLVLLDPNSRFLDYHSGLYGEPVDTMKRKIIDTADNAKKEGVEVKFWDNPLPFTLTIFDPESLAGRIRVEFQIPGGALGQAPSVMVYRRTDPKIYADLLAFFKRGIGDQPQ
jgi:hypothetical protein